MNLCLIGCGAHALNVYAPSLARLARSREGLRLAACCDLDPDKADAMRALCGFERAYTDHERMLAAEPADALLVVTPYSLTAEICENAARRVACPMMIEKPPGSTLAECRRIRRALGGRAHQVAFNRHFMPSILALREALLAERLQNIRYAMTRVNRDEPFFFVTAIHGIDVVRFVAGSPYRHCDFVYQLLPELGENCYNIHMSARFASGATAQLAFLVQGGLVAERFAADCAGKTLTLTTPIWDGADAPGALRTYEGGALTRETAFEPGPLYVTNGFYGELNAFLDNIERGVPCAPDIDWAMQSVAIAEAIRDRRPSYDAEDSPAR